MTKKIFIALVLLCFLIVLALGCSKDQYRISQSHDNIQQVDIVYIANNTIIAKGHYDSIKQVCVIEENKWESLFDQLYSIKSKAYISDPMLSLRGNAIRITYQDGAFELISKYSIFYCDSDKNGKYLCYYFDSSEIDQLIQSYSSKTGDGSLS